MLAEKKNVLSYSRFLNREASWLAFDMRVLEEAENKNHPLAERLNFLAISASNLDEFYMVRVAGLKDYMRRDITKQSPDGLTPAQELEVISKMTAELVEKQHSCWLELQKQLARKSINVVRQDALKKTERVWLESYFLGNIFPVLTPIAIDPAHPFPFLLNLSLTLVFELKKNNNSATARQMTIVPIPATLPRFILLPQTLQNASHENGQRYVMLEDVIAEFLPVLMPDFSVASSALFRIIRDSELEISDGDEDFVRNFERAVKQRRRGRVIQIKFAAPANENLVRFVSEQMGVELEDVIEVSGMLGLSALREIVENAPPDLHFAPFQVRFPERINDFAGDCFAAIKAKDIVVHHPFETFDVVVQFLRQAAADPDVVAIKQTLYRTSVDSPIASALIAAAESGKSVTALVELKARFDEETNLKWARDLESAGVQVVYGFVKLKTHAKVMLVTRREHGQLVSYAHFGTGNYHPATARSYTDLSFFTCDHDLCRDVAYLFNFVTGNSYSHDFTKLIVAPRDMRASLIAMIEQEAEHAKNGRKAAIWAKMNSLVDEQVIDALYRASQVGVSIELIVRGICCLRPQVMGMSDNIRVKSIVGRFLEHSRIYCFGNGHGLPSQQAKVYIGSADWMPRNFDWRVEVMVPIENPTVHQQIMGQIMAANLKDESQSWILGADGRYERVKPTGKAISAHDYFIKNPSLSGRGSAYSTTLGTTKQP